MAPNVSLCDTQQLYGRDMMTSSNGNIFRVTGPLCGNSSLPVNFPHKGQWRGALMFSLICVWINRWVNNREAGDLRRYRAHYDVMVMDIAYNRLGPPGSIRVVGYIQEPHRHRHIRLKHPWDQWNPSTRTVAETPGCHNSRISTETMRNHLRRFALRVRRPYRGPVLNSQLRAARLHWVTVQRLSFLNLPHTGLP